MSRLSVVIITIARMDKTKLIKLQNFEVLFQDYINTIMNKCYVEQRTHGLQNIYNITNKCLEIIKMINSRTKTTCEYMQYFNSTIQQGFVPQLLQLNDFPEYENYLGRTSKWIWGIPSNLMNNKNIVQELGYYHANINNIYNEITYHIKSYHFKFAYNHILNNFLNDTIRRLKVERNKIDFQYGIVITVISKLEENYAIINDLFDNINCEEVKKNIPKYDTLIPIRVISPYHEWQNEYNEYKKEKDQFIVTDKSFLRKTICKYRRARRMAIMKQKN